MIIFPHPRTLRSSSTFQYKDIRARPQPFRSWALKAPLLQAPLLKAPQLKAPQLKAPQLKAPQLKVPQLKAPLLQAPLLQAPLLQAPQLKAPQLKAPQLKAPQLKVPLLNVFRLLERILWSTFSMRTLTLHLKCPASCRLNQSAAAVPLGPNVTWERWHDPLPRVVSPEAGFQ